MWTLFIDTHSELLTIGLVNNDKTIVKEEISNNSHSTILLPLIKEILEEAKIEINEISRIIVVDGPGSFTGLRIGLTDAKIIGYTLNVPVIPISSLLAYLVSNEEEKIKASVVKDNRGYYILVVDQFYKEVLSLRYLLCSDETINNYYIIENKLDVKRISDYANNLPSTFIHNLKANYVKKIEAQK